jgi:hypothetical protein
VFRGVPFAAPPVGRNRFAAPRPGLVGAGNVVTLCDLQVFVYEAAESVPS